MDKSLLLFDFLRGVYELMQIFVPLCIAKLRPGFGELMVLEFIHRRGTIFFLKCSREMASLHLVRKLQLQLEVRVMHIFGPLSWPKFF